MVTAGLPDYDSLPPAPDGGRSGWGLFGTDDAVGLLNLQTPERTAAAARCVRRGTRFPLDLPWGTFAPPLNSARGNPRHHVINQPGGIGLDDVWDNVFPQAGSQWDSLAHIGYTRAAYYNGFTEQDIRAGRSGVDHWARRGIAGRAILLDMPAVIGTGYDPSDTVEFGVDELEAAREIAGVRFEPGDTLLLHTGFTAWYREQPLDVRKKLPTALRAPGLAHSEDVCRYLWNAHVAAIASDTFAVEAWPADTRPEAAPFGFLHQMLIGSFGMALGELWWLHDLARDCAQTGVYEAFLVSSPSAAPGGISSAANAIALK